MDGGTGIDGREVGHGRLVVGVGIVLTLALVGGLVRTVGTSGPERSVAGDWYRSCSPS